VNELAKELARDLGSELAKDLGSELEKELAKDLGKELNRLHQDYSRHRIHLLKRLQGL
jgi:hypothetical protein